MTDMTKETTLVILKPDTVSLNRIGIILDALTTRNRLVVHGLKMFRFTPELLREHYAHNVDKPFYPKLEAFMMSAPCVAVALRGDNAVQETRVALGPTDPSKAHSWQLRGIYGGEEIMMNVAHASDSLAAAQEELARFFKPEELFTSEQ